MSAKELMVREGWSIENGDYTSKSGDYEAVHNSYKSREKRKSLRNNIITLVTAASLTALTFIFTLTK